MPSSTTPSGIIFPVPSDPIAPLNAVFQDLAESTQSALLVRNETAEREDDYTLQLSDAGLVVSMNKPTAATLTVPLNSAVGFPVGTLLWVYNQSSADVTVVGDSGVAVRNAGTVGEFEEVSLRKRDTNEWVMNA